MTEHAFLEVLSDKAARLRVNPFLLLSGLEGLYTFRHTPLNAINYPLLDSLILTIFTLRIGDRFHEIAQQNLLHENGVVRDAAARELRPMNNAELESSNNPYLASFVRLVNGSSPIRKYHEKALEAAALDIEETQNRFGSNSISTVILGICKDELQDGISLDALFNNARA
jgi:hypothetical protein